MHYNHVESKTNSTERATVRAGENTEGPTRGTEQGAPREREREREKERGSARQGGTPKGPPNHVLAATRSQFLAGWKEGDQWWKPQETLGDREDSYLAATHYCQDCSTALGWQIPGLAHWRLGKYLATHPLDLPMSDFAMSAACHHHYPFGQRWGTCENREVTLL